MYCVQPSTQTPDIEPLLLDTARHGGADSRLFTMAAAWLSRHGGFVDVRRLARLVEGDLAPDDRPAMGLLLEMAGASSTSNSFDEVIAACGPPLESRPMFDVYREQPAFAVVAEREATPLSRKWGRWVTEARLKTDALRPHEWIIAQNPSLAGRGLMRNTRETTATNPV